MREVHRSDQRRIRGSSLQPQNSSYLWRLTGVFLGLCVLATSASAATATYAIDLLRGDQSLMSREVSVSIGDEVAIYHTVPFHVDRAACSDAQGLPGTGKEGETIVLHAMDVGEGAVTTLVDLDSSQLVRAVPMDTGGCQAQTVAMLKWGMSVKFDVAVGRVASFRGDDLIVKVHLLRFTDQIAPSPERIAL